MNKLKLKKMNSILKYLRGKEKYFLCQIFLIICLFSMNSFAQKGLFAGNMSAYIGKKYQLDKMDLALPGWKYFGGYFLSFENNAEFNIAIDFYKKGSTQIIILSKKSDNENDGNIEDIIELKNVLKNQNIQSASCAVGKNDPDIEIIALDQTIGKLTKIQKAWRANRDKLHFEAISTKGINCMVEGAD